MAARNLPNPRTPNNVVGLEEIFLKVTFAADAEADGLTVNFGGGYLATTAYSRTSEGLWVFNLKQKYKRLVWADAQSNTSGVRWEWVSEDTDADTPVVTMRSITGSSGSAVDDDGAVVLFRLALQNSGLNY